MIIDAKISEMPRSGEYDEVIFDHQDVWNSSVFGWIKFTNDDYLEWFGSFRGKVVWVEVSTVLNLVLVLTSDYIYKLSIESGELIEVFETDQIKSVAVSSKGKIFTADYYTISEVNEQFEVIKNIEAPFQLDMIKFLEWKNDSLLFRCIEFLDSFHYYEMLLDSETYSITEQAKFEEDIEKNNSWWKFQ